MTLTRRRIGAVARRDEVIAFADDLLDLAAWPDYGADGHAGRRRGRGDEDRVRGLGLARAVRAGGGGRRATSCSSTTGCSGTTSRGRSTTACGASSRRSSGRASRSPPTTSRSTRTRRSATTRCSRASSASSVEAPFADIGVGGRLEPPVDPSAFGNGSRERLGREPTSFLEGPGAGRRVAIISGGGRALRRPRRPHEGYDLFLTGEPAEPSLHAARELGIHFVAAGHYATERLGVQALAARLGERFGLAVGVLRAPEPGLAASASGSRRRTRCGRSHDQQVTAVGDQARARRRSARAYSKASPTGT